MAYEPFNIFSHRVDPVGVIRVLRRVACEVHIEGPADDWTRLVALGTKWPFRKRPELCITHDSSYYTRPGFPRILASLVNHFQQLDDAPRKREVLLALRGCQFALGFMTDMSLDGRDERIGWIHAICQHLDGMLFTPTSLRDASGRILYSATEDADLQAVLPAYVPAADEFDDVPLPSLDEENDSSPGAPPSAVRVCQRAFVLLAVVARGLTEHENADDPEADETCQRAVEWLTELGLEDEVEPGEWEVLQRRPGSLQMQAMIDAIWRCEGLAVLAWALQLYELPEYDALAQPPELGKVFAFLKNDEARALLANARLRPLDELLAMQKTLLALHWRVRNERLHPGPFDFVAFSKQCWFGSFDLSPFRIIENDLAIGDHPISAADPELVGRTASAALERHLAINWLLGESQIYSRTDTST